MLSGKKTFIVGGVLAVIAILYAVGVIDLEAFAAVAAVLLGGGLITTRLAIRKQTLPKPKEA